MHQDVRNLTDVEGHDRKRDQHIGTGHERYDQFGEAGDAADAAKDDDAGQYRDTQPDSDLRDAECGFDCAGDRVRLHRVEDEAEGQDQADGKD